MSRTRNEIDYDAIPSRHGDRIIDCCSVCRCPLVIDAIRGEALCTNHDCTKYVPLTPKSAPNITEDARV